MSSLPLTDLTCAGCGVKFPTAGALGNHGRWSKTCTYEARFWGKVDKTSGAASCWIWDGAKTTHGYGCGVYKGRVLGAHKIAYVLTNGEVPAGMEIMHSCDNRRCVNPAHLSIGTKDDNARDKAAKGRGPKKNPHKLTPDDVREIRGLRGKASSGEIARRYGITQPYAFAIWGGRVWKNVQ